MLTYYIFKTWWTIIYNICVLKDSEFNGVKHNIKCQLIFIVQTHIWFQIAFLFSLCLEQDLFSSFYRSQIFSSFWPISYQYTKRIIKYGDIFCWVITSMLNTKNIPFSVNKIFFRFHLALHLWGVCFQIALIWESCLIG